MMGDGMGGRGNGIRRVGRRVEDEGERKGGGRREEGGGKEEGGRREEGGGRREEKDIILSHTRTTKLRTDLRQPLLALLSALTSCMYVHYCK